MSALFEQVETITNRDDLVAFVRALQQDIVEHADEWESVDLLMYLDSLATWIECSPQRHRNLGEEPPKEPSWSEFGEMLLAPRYYE